MEQTTQVTFRSLPEAEVEFDGQLHRNEYVAAKKIADEALRKRFAWRRWIYRQQLGEFLDVPPEDLVPEFDANGRPWYSLNSAPVPVAISTASAVERVGVIISNEFPNVGIDFVSVNEPLFANLDEGLPRIVNTFLAPAEAVWVLSDAPELRKHRLAQILTYKQAADKATGLRLNLTEMSLLSDSDELVDGVQTPEGLIHIQELDYAPLDMSADLVAAVAMQESAEA